MYNPQIELWAGISFQGAAVPTIVSNSGKVASVTSGGAGVYNVNLQASEGVDNTERFITAQLISNATGWAVIDQAASTDTLIRVLTFNAAGAPAHADVHVVIHKKRTV